MLGRNDPGTRKAARAARWYKPGEPAQIGPWLIPDGMVYAGGSISVKRGSGYVVEDGCAIDPDLEIATSDADRTGSLLWYWPRYDQIDPRCRLAYLEWLSDGKHAPDTNLGYVFLYFYGIERRVFVEGFESWHELNALTEEVQRLLRIYGANSSFRGYASKFLETIALLRGIAANQSFEPDLDPEARGLSVITKVAIGRLLAKGQPVPFDWMMAWWLEDLSTRLRATCKRCFPEFVDLVRARFSRRYPLGVQIEAPKSKLTLHYRGASAAVSWDLSQVFRELVPDIETVRRPLGYMGEIVEEAMADISSFARFVGRYPEQRTSFQAAALLPPECEPNWLREQLTPIADLVSRAERADQTVQFGRLAQTCGLPTSERLGRKALETIAVLLARIGIGLEPDPLYGATTASKDDSAHIFRSTEELRARPDDAYCLALAMTTLIAGIASTSNAGLGPAERRFLGWIEKQLGLDPAQRLQLEAHLDWLIAKKVRFTHVRKLMRELPAAQRATMSALAIVVAKADGIIEPAEMQFLEMLFDELGI